VICVLFIIHFFIESRRSSSSIDQNKVKPIKPAKKKIDDDDSFIEPSNNVQSKLKSKKNSVVLNLVCLDANQLLIEDLENNNIKYALNKNILNQQKKPDSNDLRQVNTKKVNQAPALIDHYNNTGDLLQDDLRRVNSKQVNQAQNSLTDYSNERTNNTSETLQDDLRKVNSKRVNQASNNSADYNKEFTNEFNSRQAKQTSNNRPKRSSIFSSSNNLLDNKFIKYKRRSPSPQ